MKKKVNKNDFLTESLVEKSKTNIFKQDDPKEERKILTKEQFEKEDMRRKTETSGFKKKKQSKKTVYESIKRPKYKKKKPSLMINTDMEETGVRRAATTKHAGGGKNVFLDNDNYQDEYFESEKSVRNKKEKRPSKKIKRNMSLQKVVNPKKQALEKPSISQEPIFNFNKRSFKVVFYKYSMLYNFVCEFNELIEKGEDPYDVVRKYVDFIQDRKFNDLIDIICNQRYRKNINKALLFERWAIFTTFYIYLDRRMVEKSKYIKNFANCVFQNMLLCFMLFKIEIMQLDGEHK